MDLLKKHMDTLIILGAFASSVLWMNGRFNEVDKRFSDLEKDALDIVHKLMYN